MALGDEPVAELAVVLDDPVQDDRELRAVAAGERMRVRLGDAAVRRPARVPEPVRGRRAVRACRRPSGSAGCRPRGRSRARLPRAARSRPSRSRGTRAARDPAAGAALHSLGPTYPMIPHIQAPFLARCPRRNSLENAQEPGAGLSKNRPATSRASRAPPGRGTRSYHRDRALPASVSASPSTLIKGSVPDARTSTRPVAVELGVQPLRLGERGRRAPRARRRGRSPAPARSAASPRPPRPGSSREIASQRSSAAASPSPVTWSRRQITWPDCSPPRIAPSRRSASST